MTTPSQNCDAILVHKLRSRIKQMQSVMSGQLLFFSRFITCGLDLRVFPAETRLTVYCWLSQRRVGGSYALRVSPAVTRLTVYRRRQVCGKRGLQVTRAQDPWVTFE